MTLPHDVARCTGRIKTAQTAFDMSDAPTPSRHYEFAHSCLHQESGLVLNRIRALRDIPAHGVKAGDLGGYVESESNLEQGSNAWVAEMAKAIGDARVSGAALVEGEAVVKENAQIMDSARVCGRATVAGSAVVKDRAVVSHLAFIGGKACVYENAQVSGGAEVGENARVFGKAMVSSSARVRGNARIYDEALVFYDAQISGNVWVYGRATVKGSSELSGFVHVYDRAIVEDSVEAHGYSLIHGNAWVSGHANIGGHAVVSKDRDYLHFGPFTINRLWLTAHRDLNRRVRIAVGKFEGNLAEFEAYVKQQRGHEALPKTVIAFLLEAIRETFPD